MRNKTGLEEWAACPRVWLNKGNIRVYTDNQGFCGVFLSRVVYSDFFDISVFSRIRVLLFTGI
jgi:hypothetical protein